VDVCVVAPKLLKNGSLNALPGIRIGECDTCAKVKMSQLPFSQSKTRSSKPLDLIHSDLCGPMQTATRMTTTNDDRLWLLSLILVM
jgi:hypothetical protein